jgi:peptidoglycan-N-acetylglucosamine deacetylase
MKKHCFLIGAILISCGICYSRTIDTPYVVATWHNFCPAASTFTFDDGCAHQFTIAVPMFSAKNLHATFYTVISTMFPGWPNLQSAAAKGHEIASHTMTHPQNLGTLSTAQQTTELQNSRDQIRQNIPGEQCIDLAYPNCNPSTDAITRQYYFAARNCSGQIVPKTPTDFNAISCFICGNTGTYNTAAALISLANNAVGTNGWTVYLTHDIDSLNGHNHGGYSPTAQAALQGWVNFMDTNRTKFWVETFGNVVRYIKERDSASVRGISRTTDSITLSVTDGLNDTFFNYPITIRRPLPSGWTTVKVTQGATTLTAQTKDSNAVKYVIFDAVPDKGNIIISRNGTGVQNAIGGAAVSGATNVWFTHKSLRFFVPASAGLKLDVALYDLTGAQVADYKVNRKENKMGTVCLPAAVVKSGMYIVQISDGKSLWSKQCFSQ